jgi:KaiC/GvpD/RAD55 family RecA-like ATPase
LLLASCKRFAGGSKDGLVLLAHSQGYNVLFRTGRAGLSALKDSADDIIPSGVDGLDKLLHGGVPRGHSVIVEGPPGAGKTVFSFSFLYHGAVDKAEPGIYVTLEESPLSIRRNMTRFGMSAEELEKKNMLAILDFSIYHGLSADLGEEERNAEFLARAVARSVRDKAESIKAKRLVVDSLTAILDHYPETQRRAEFLNLLATLRYSGLTSFLLTETPARDQPNLVQSYLVDGNITLRLVPSGSQGEMIRTVQIPKMRGLKHDFEIHPFQISDRGIVVFPDDRVYSGAQAVS